MNNFKKTGIFNLRLITIIILFDTINNIKYSLYKSNITYWSNQINVEFL